jgi:hypothetical protein
LKRNDPTTKRPKDSASDTRPKGAQRLELVRAGHDQGKSQREMAREQGFDEGTIRRDIAKLSLPQDKLVAIQKGDSAEKHLNQARFEKTGKERSADRKRLRRLVAELETGEHSSPSLSWCATGSLRRISQRITNCSSSRKRRLTATPFQRGWAHRIPIRQACSLFLSGNTNRGASPTRPSA